MLTELEKLKVTALTHGFKLLDTEWKGPKGKYTFEYIASGKTYLGTYNQLMTRGFPNNFRRPLTKKWSDLAAYSGQHGFQLLEKEWLGIDINHRFLHISSGKIYSAPPDRVYSRGFPKSLKTPEERFNDLKALASVSGFQLLENEWKGNAAVYQFKHISSQRLYQWTGARVVKLGFPKSLRTNSDRFNELAVRAQINGFRLISEQWRGYIKKHQFEHVATGDIYDWSPAEILRTDSFPLVRGQRYVTEEICRQIMKHIFGGEFKSDFHRLSSLHGKNIEIDGIQQFSDVPEIIKNAGRVMEMNGKKMPHNFSIKEIAFEFQGHQAHLENEKVIERDNLRVEYCQKLGILLVVIEPPPNWNMNRNSDYMFRHVSNAIANALKTERPLFFKKGFKINLQNWNPDKKAFDELRELSKKHGFEVLSDTWGGAKTPLLFKKIDTGSLHSWTPQSIKFGGFPKDLRTDADKFENLLKRAHADGYEVLETKWLGVKVKHKFRQLSTGNIYAAIPDNVLMRGFPKDITNSQQRLDKLRDVAKKFGFILLDSDWKGTKSKYTFRHELSQSIYEGLYHNVIRVGFPKIYQSATITPPNEQFLKQNKIVQDLLFDTPALIISNDLPLENKDVLLLNRDGLDHDGFSI